MSSKRYTPEFRTEAVRQVTERGYPVREVAGRLGVSTYSLYKWFKGVGKTPRLVEQEDLCVENARLKTELKRAEEEIGILKKNTADTDPDAYSIYNWELFYYVPITIAIHLSKDQRFAEAQRWFHYVFDPTENSDGPTPERYWKVRLFQDTDIKKIEEILVNFANGADETLRDEIIHSIEAWKDAPFPPHVIPRYRQQAYIYMTVIAYLDNLIAWGDALFRQDTFEAINEAITVYTLAADILGHRPQPTPKKGSVRPQTNANLRQDLSQFGKVIRDMEPALPFDLIPFSTGDEGDNDRLATLGRLGKALNFFVPGNDKLLSYWDTVADRLFKIRNSHHIPGDFC